MVGVRARAAGMAAVAVVAALTGCGDDEDAGGSTQGGGGSGAFDVQAVRALPSQATDAGTFSFEMTTAYLLGGDRSLELAYSGSVDVGAQEATMQADITDFVTDLLIPMSNIGSGSEAQADDLPDEVLMPIVLDGEVGYMEFAGVLNDIAPEDQRQPSLPRWVRFGPSDLDGGSGFTGFMSGADPEGILALLGAASGEVDTVGDEDVRGEPATHLRAAIDLATARERAPEDQRAMIDDIAGEGDAQVDEVPIDVWIGEDGRLLRFAVEIERDMTVTTESPGGPPLPSDAAGSVTSLAYDVLDYGEPVEVEIPPAAEVIEASELDDIGVVSPGD